MVASNVAILGRTRAENANYGPVDALVEFCRGYGEPGQIFYVDEKRPSARAPEDLTLDFNEENFPREMQKRGVGFVVFDCSVWKFVQDPAAWLGALASHLVAPGLVLIDSVVDLAPCVRPTFRRLPLGRSRLEIRMGRSSLLVDDLDLDATTCDDLKQRIIAHVWEQPGVHAQHLHAEDFRLFSRGRQIGDGCTSLRGAGIGDVVYFVFQLGRWTVPCMDREWLRRLWKTPRFFRGAYPLPGAAHARAADYTVLTARIRVLAHGERSRSRSPRRRS